MNNSSSILNGADLDRVTGGSKIGQAAQQVSGLFKAVSDIGQAATQLLPPAVGDLLAHVRQGH